MKKTFIYLFSLCLLAGLCSCKKNFLEIVPQGYIIPTKTSDYNLMLNNPNLYVYKNAGNAIEALMGDEVSAETSQFTTANAPSQNSFIWAENIILPSTGGGGDASLDLYNYLQNLYICNKIINSVNEATGPESDKKQLMAEAYANRAFIYFQLINTYAKPYAASTAAADLGFPIIKEASVNQSFPTRNTVQEGYDLIVADLKEAIAVLPLQHPAGVTRMGKVGAEALLGKVYTFMGKYNDALPVLKQALIDNAASSVPARLYNYNNEFAPGGRFYPITSSGPTNAPGNNYIDNTEAVLSKSFYNGPRQGGPVGTDFIVLSKAARELFGANDLRLNFYAAKFPYSQPNPSGRLSKYAVRYAKFGVQLSELYLLLAEAMVKTNDFTGAKENLELLRKNRMPLTDATVPQSALASQLALLLFVQDERIREFATEGYRWFDMRRMSVDASIPSQSYTHTLYKNTGDTEVTIYALKPERMTLKLPPYIMNANPQFVNNP